MRFCKFCDIEDWNEPQFSRIAGEILGSGEAPQHRKVWEFAQTARTLQEFGMLDERAHLLSVAAGQEHILFYLANRVRRMVATDIYGQGAFSYREAGEEFLANQQRFAPYPYREDHLRAFSMDALDLRFPDESFDAVFSLSSIEHFGGREAAKQSVREMDRVLKPGGIAIVVADGSVNDRGTDQILNHKDLRILSTCSSLTPVSPLHWGISEQSKKQVVRFGDPDFERLPHVLLSLFSSQFTSYCLVLQKPGDFSFSDPRKFDEMLSQVQKAPLDSKVFPIPLRDRWRSKSRVWVRRVEGFLQSSLS